MTELTLIAIGFVAGSLFTAYCWRKEMCNGFQPKNIDDSIKCPPPSNRSSAKAPYDKWWSENK